MNARIVVGQGSCGLAAGAGAVYTALESKLTADVRSVNQQEVINTSGSVINTFNPLFVECFE
jgi:hypothetical protein